MMIAIISKSFVLVAVAFVVYSENATAQVVFPGSCADLPVVQNFEVARYLGRWYEIERYFTSFQTGGICVTATYTDLGNATVGVFNRMKIETTGEIETIEGYAKIVDPNGGGKLAVVFPSQSDNREAPYWVMDTDYESYSLVWACSNFGQFNFQFVWYLAREQFPSEEILTRIYESMHSLGLATENLIKTDQTNCSDAV